MVDIGRGCHRSANCTIFSNAFHRLNSPHSSTFSKTLSKSDLLISLNCAILLLARKCVINILEMRLLY